MTTPRQAESHDGVVDLLDRLRRKAHPVRGSNVAERVGASVGAAAGAAVGGLLDRGRGLFVGAVAGGVAGALTGRELWCRWHKDDAAVPSASKAGGAAGATGGAIVGAAAGAVAGPAGVVAGAAVGSAAGDKLGRGAAACVDGDARDPASDHDLAAGAGSAGGAVSADDESEEKAASINNNVLIEIGAAFVLYDQRVVLLWDKRLKVPSNLQGLYRCEFEGSDLTFATGTRLAKAVKSFRK